MAKKKRFEGMKQWEIDEIKQQRLQSLVFALMFIVMIAGGILLANADSCGENADPEQSIVSGTSAVQMVSDTNFQ